MKSLLSFDSTRALRGVTLVAMIAGGFTLSCSKMAREVRIHAPPDLVWEEASDFKGYSEWNPFFTSIEGELKAKQKVRVTMQPLGKKVQKFSPKILSVSPGKNWVWRGRLGIPGLFDGRHTFTIQRVDDTTVIFRQEERFSGLFVPFLDYRPYSGGWVLMNEALRDRAENRIPQRKASAQE